jgi:flagellar biosynthetic protein FliP
MGALRVVLSLALMFAAPWALAADPLQIPALTMTSGANGQQEYSVNLQILLIMTALSFIPAFVMLMTSFTRIIIVFSILRQALGLQQTPSNQLLTGMALFLTMFIMAPVFEKVNQQALQPYLISCWHKLARATWSCSCACPSAPTFQAPTRPH